MEAVHEPMTRQGRSVGEVQRSNSINSLGSAPARTCALIHMSRHMRHDANMEKLKKPLRRIMLVPCVMYMGFKRIQVYTSHSHATTHAT